MTSKTVELDVLSQALKLEQQGREFYLKAAEETLDEKGKKMFLSLADDERLHLEIIQRQLHALEGEGKFVLLPNLSVPDIDLGVKLFPPERSKIQERVGVNPGEIDALHVALDNEIKSYDLYRAAAQRIQDQAGKAMYQWLASAEMTHFNLLMTNYEAIVRGSGWV